MTKRVFVSSFLLLVASTACSPAGGATMTPSEDRRPAELLQVIVSPASGSGDFTAEVVFSHGSAPDRLECEYGDPPAKVYGVHSADIAEDNTLRINSITFAFSMPEPGEWRVECRWSEARGRDPVTTGFTVVGRQ